MKNRPTKRQRYEIHKAQFETNALRQTLSAERKLHPLVIAKIQSTTETEARSNAYGSRFYRKIYPTQPLSAKEIRDAFRAKKEKL